MVASLGGCPRRQAPVLPLTDSTTARLRADSLVLIARRDSAAAAAARDSAAARARADSLARLDAERARADSVRAQVLRDSASAPAPTPSGLDSAGERTLGEAIHFDYDRADIRSQDGALMDRKLALLRAAPRLEVEIEGHCDDRGPDEYNLALGLRRAEAVARWFTEHGIAGERLAIVSYGEERPVDRSGTEDAMARNRRAEFRVTRGAR